MSNEIQIHQRTAGQIVKGLLDKGGFRNRFNEVLGKRAELYMASIVNVANTLPADTEPNSILSSAFVAATLNLPVDKNLGFAWIIPYKKQGRNVAQFQMGYKGYIQLGLRSGQFKQMNDFKLNAEAFESFNPVTGKLVIDVSQLDEDSKNIVGYGFYFQLSNGFEKTTYWPKSKVEAHAKKHSKSFNSDQSRWQIDFDAMALKTVISASLRKYGILSVEMQQALKMDSAVISEPGAEPEYPDNPEIDTATTVTNATSATFGDDDQIPGAEIKPATAAPQQSAGEPEKAKEVKQSPTPQERLSEALASAGITMDELNGWATQNGQLANEYGSISELPTSFCEYWLPTKRFNTLRSGIEKARS